MCMTNRRRVPMRVLWVRSPRPRLRLTTNELSMLSAGTMR